MTVKGKFAKDVIIKNCTPVDAENIYDRSDILIKDGIIEAIVPAGCIAVPQNIPVYDADGAYAAPAFIDIHTHLRDPGYTDKETVESGTAAAAAGGYGTVVPMPNTDPVTDSPEVIADLLRRAAETAHCRVLPAGAITVGEAGKELTDFVSLDLAGAVAFSDDGRPVSDLALMKNAMELAARNEFLIISHSEDLTVTRDGVINEGEISKSMGLPGIPNASEDNAIEREIELCRVTGAHIHFAHVSTARGVELIRSAKKDGLTVTGETCPHYIYFSDRDVQRLGTNGKMKPPLRSPEDREAVIAGILDGTLDCISTDHAPHTDAAKGTLEKGAFGIIGLQTAFAASYTVLVKERGMALNELVRRMSTMPAMILGLGDGRGFLDYGAPGDVVIFDESCFTFEKRDIRSKSNNTPFIGQKLFGRVLATFVGGEKTY